MHGKQLKVLMIIAAIALIGLSACFMKHVRERHKVAEREAEMFPPLSTQGKLMR